MWNAPTEVNVRTSTFVAPRKTAATDAANLPQYKWSRRCFLNAISLGCLLLDERSRLLLPGRLALLQRARRQLRGQAERRFGAALQIFSSVIAAAEDEVGE